MHIELLQNLGLSKNEAEIYEALLKLDESSVSTLSAKTNINRRNIYDVLNRLSEKGLVFTVLQKGENRYKPVEPEKLREVLREKETMLNHAMPSLSALYHANPKENEVYIYKGVEGWKNYMRDIVAVGEDFYCIGGKGAWMDQRVMNFFPRFIQEAKKKKINYYHLFDSSVKNSKHNIVKYVGKNYKFFPEKYDAPASIDIFGDHVNLVSNIHLGGMEEEFSFTVIVNQQIADAFRIWFQYMWDFCPEPALQRVGSTAQSGSGRNDDSKKTNKKRKV